MSELFRRFLPNRETIKPEVLPPGEQWQREIFGDVLASIAKQGKVELTRRGRRHLAGRETTVFEPGLTQGQQLRLLKPTPFTIMDGTTLYWKDLPTAVAYGHLPEEDKLLLVGGVHYPNILQPNRIDLKDATRMTALIGEFPGHFLQPSDY